MSKKILGSGLIAVLLMAVFLSSTYATETAKDKELKKAKELYNKIEVLYSEKAPYKEGYDKTIKECRKLIKKYPHTEYAAKAQYKIAEIQQDYGNYLDAIKEYEKAIIDYPKNERVAEAQYYIGELCEHLPDYDRAIEAYKKVISNHPGSEYAAKAQSDIGRIHEEKQEYNQAIAEYFKVVTNYPDSEYVTNAKVRISACIEKISISDLDKFINDYPKSVYIAKAESLLLVSMSRAKMEELNKFIEENPESKYIVKAKYYIGQLYESQHLYCKAIEEYLKAIADYPNSEYIPEVKERISTIINTELSVSQLKDFVKEHPKSEFITEAKARISYVEKKEREEAKAREEERKEASQTEGIREYFPLTTGRTWEYNMSGFLLKEEVIMAETIGTTFHSLVKRIAIINSSPIESKKYYKIESNTIILHKVGGLLGSREVNQPALKFPLTVGKSWYFYDDGAKVTKKVISTNETVTVPAGTFTQCVAVKEACSIDSPDEYKVLYYAPNVGLVLEKLHTRSGFSRFSELIKYE